MHAPRPSQGSTLQAALRRGLEATAEALEIMATQGSDWVEGKETVLGGGGAVQELEECKMPSPSSPREERDVVAAEAVKSKGKRTLESGQGGH